MSENPICVLEETYARLVRDNGYAPVSKGQPSAAQRAAPHWTRAECVDLLRLWVQAYGALPLARDCEPQQSLPDKLRIRQIFGSHKAWIQEAVDCLPTEGSGQIVRCLKCDKRWCSPDKRYSRICPRCTHLRQATREDAGAWMNGTVLW